MITPQAGDRVSEYVLHTQVGAGSFGQVWKAHHHIWRDQVVAIKIPTDAQYVRNLQHEGTAIHGLRHPNIVRAVGFDPYAEIPYLVMEFVDGPSLRKLIEANKQGLPVLPAQRILTAILRALGTAHTAGVIHRDVKPENILVEHKAAENLGDIEIADVRVTDFGLGKVTQVTTNSIMQSGSLLSEEGKTISGTLAYMAPEQRDEGRSDARSDLYAVGIILFEMVCGQRPSGSDLPSHVRDGLPAWVDAVYAKLYTRWERRYASAEEVLEVIDRTSAPPVVERGRSRATPPPPVRMPQEPMSHAGRCPSCNAKAEPGDNFCILCGKQLVASPRRCTACGGYPGEDDRFCIFCGTKLAAMAG